MSSNSSATEGGATGPLARLLADSFQVLERGLPEASRRLCAVLEGVSLGMQVDEESFAVEFSARGARVRAATGQESAQVSLSRHTLWEVLENRLGLTEAVVADAVRVVGPLDTLLRLHEGLRLYVHGAARCPSFMTLLKCLRDACLPVA